MAAWASQVFPTEEFPRVVAALQAAQACPRPQPRQHEPSRHKPRTQTKDTIQGHKPTRKQGRKPTQTCTNRHRTAANPTDTKSTPDSGKSYKHKIDTKSLKRHAHARVRRFCLASGAEADDTTSTLRTPMTPMIQMTQKMARCGASPPFCRRRRRARGLLRPLGCGPLPTSGGACPRATRQACCFCVGFVFVLCLFCGLQSCLRRFVPFCVVFCARFSPFSSRACVVLCAVASEPKNREASLLFLCLFCVVARRRTAAIKWWGVPRDHEASLLASCLFFLAADVVRIYGIRDKAQGSYA